MFTVSKIFWMIVNPINIFIFLLITGAILLLTRHRSIGRKLVLSATAFMMFFAVVPIGDWLTERLENRFPSNPTLSPDIAGIIVLGGAINQYITTSRQQPALTSSGERYTEFVYLSRRFPEAQLIFTGGSGSILDQSMKEADAAKSFFKRAGLEGNKVLYERNSRNTFENAVFSRKLASGLINEQWVLVTSALHMPRAVGVFRKAGWRVVPYPVDYLTDGRKTFQLALRPFYGLTSLNRGGREWIGLLAYFVLGRTDTFFPSQEAIADN